MKKREYTFEYLYRGQGSVTVTADSIEEAVEMATEAAHDLLPNNADDMSLEIGDLLDQTTIGSWCTI